MEVLHLAEKLCSRIKDRIEKTEYVERAYVGDVTSKIKLQDLKSEMIKDREIAENMVQEIKKSNEPLNPKRKKELEDKIKELEEKITEQDDKIKDLETKLSAVQADLDELKNSLRTGQLSFDFEKDLATYIYPEGKKIGSRKIFSAMKSWLKKKKHTSQGQASNKKWNDLKTQFSWSEKHEQVFFKLLEYRREFAHPVRDADEFQIPDDFTNEEKMCIRTINNMIERVNELMG